MGFWRDVLQSGTAGSAAMVVQVTSLMWLRTTANYQYARGGGTAHALRALYSEGGLPRFYRGFPVALVHAPLMRFGDIASYTAARRLELPTWQETALATAGSSAWKLALMPLDTLKTSMQVHGGIDSLARKVRAAGPSTLFHGYLGAAGAGVMGYYPWFFTYGWLEKKVPEQDGRLAALARHAGMGFAASAVSDTVSNAARVVKVGRQTHGSHISYVDAARRVLAQDGVRGLLGRGLRTKILANGIQGATFSVAWRYMEKSWKERDARANNPGAEQ